MLEQATPLEQTEREEDEQGERDEVDVETMQGASDRGRTEGAEKRARVPEVSSGDDSDENVESE